MTSPQIEIPPVVKPMLLAPLQEYYGKIFPAGKMVRWLSYGKESTFSKREFSFCKTAAQSDPTVKAKEIYTRYRCFSGVDQFKQSLRSWNPDKIDIGAVYSMPPTLGKGMAKNVFFPTQRELVFDIDASDYDDVRACCQEKKVCRECWHLMACGMQVLDFILERDFGFQHRLWIFSGRRGVHCWVCDESARQMTDEERSSLAKYVSIMDGGTSMKMSIDRNLEYNQLHPTLSDVYHKFIVPGFERIFLSPPLGTANNILLPTMAARVVEFVRSRAPTPAIAERVGELLKEAANTSDARGAWSRVSDLLQKMKWVEMALKFAFVFPRLDEAVSMKRNHLLKAPFAVHPSTGKVCVPIDVQSAHEFDPDTEAPLLSNLMQQLALGETPTLPQMPLFDDFLSRLEIQEGRAGLAAAFTVPSAVPAP